MILIIENKDDPAGQIAEESEGDAVFVYIPVITAPTESDALLLKTKCAVDRMCYERRKSETEEPPPSENAQKFMPLFLKAVGHIGRRPEYLSAPVSTALFGAEPENGHVGLCARG